MALLRQPWLCLCLFVFLLISSPTDEGITGDVLAALQHAELKELGVGSVGHRLTILKAVYDIKIRQNVPMDPDDYVPLCACSFFLLLFLPSAFLHTLQALTMHSCRHIGTGSSAYTGRLCQSHSSSPSA